MNAPPFPRAVRPAPAPLGLYFRAGRNDHTCLSNTLLAGFRSFFGIVFEATRVKRHKELLELTEQYRLESILDPSTQASATVGGYNKSHAALPWGYDRPHQLQDFEGSRQESVVASLADFLIEHRFSQVLAPTHYVRNESDPWLERDVESTYRLRQYLDRRGARNVSIIYSLTLPYSVFRDEDARNHIIEALDGIPAHSLWLKIDGCGNQSSPAGVKNYIEAARDFHHLGIPIVADHMGGLVGMSILSLSAVGGIACGITLGEQFNAQHWKKASSGGGHMQHPRVYLPQLDLYLKPAEAKQLLSSSSKLRAHLACSDRNCCPRGAVDMIENASRHYVIQRMKQVSELGQLPEAYRAKEFLERCVRPTTDYVLRLSTVDHLGEALQKRVLHHRKRLDALRVSLGKLTEDRDKRTRSVIPVTRANREDRIPRI